MMADEKKSNGHTGYDVVIHRNWEVFRDTLEGLDYRGFLRGCPRHPGRVTMMDLEWALKMKKAAEGFAQAEGNDPEEIPVPGNPYDRFAFSEFCGSIVKIIELEIKRSDPRNLEAEATKGALKSLNLSALEVIREVAPAKVEEAIKRDRTVQKSENREDLENAVNELNEKDGEKDRRIAALEADIEKLKSAPVPAPLTVPTQPERARPWVPDRLPLKMKVERFWTLKLKDIDDSPRIMETRGKENGGNIPVQVSIGDGNFTWIVITTPEGQSVLYERFKKILIDFLVTGKVKSDLTYSVPSENERRTFAPEVMDGQVSMERHWEPVRGIFSKEITRDVGVRIGDSSWTVNVRMKLNEVEKFKEVAVELVTRILLTGEVVLDDGPYA